MDVSENNGTPKSSILIGFSMIFTIHLGYAYFWKHPYHKQKYQPSTWGFEKIERKLFKLSGPGRKKTMMLGRRYICAKPIGSIHTWYIYHLPYIYIIHLTKCNIRIIHIQIRLCIPWHHGWYGTIYTLVFFGGFFGLSGSKISMVG